jgi:hypothetical protein
MRTALMTSKKKQSPDETIRELKEMQLQTRKVLQDITARQQAADERILHILEQLTVLQGNIDAAIKGMHERHSTYHDRQTKMNASINELAKAKALQLQHGEVLSKLQQQCTTLANQMREHQKKYEPREELVKTLKDSQPITLG